MLSSVRKIGELVKDVRRKVEGYIFVITLDENNSYQGIEKEQFQFDKIDLYLYKEGESKGNRPAPIAPITDAEKTFRKIRTWIEICKNVPDLTDNEREFIKNILKNIDDAKQHIIETLKKKIKEIPKKENKFLTLKLEAGSKYLGNCELFQKAHQYIILKKIQKTSSQNKVCSICGEIRDVVFARTFVYNFDTDDKLGFISGFDKQNFWKNIPVCQECRDLLKQGREFIDLKLTFKFYGLKYQLIPKTLLDDNKIIREIIDILSDTQKAIFLTKRTIKRLTNDENEILAYLSEKGDVVSFNFLFIQSQQSAERILLLIEDILPSRLRKIFETKEKVDFVFKEEFNFGKIRTFFLKSDEDKRDSDLDKYFLEIIDSIFRGKSLDFSFIVKFFMQSIKNEFIKDGYYLSRTKDAMMCVSFFETLCLINFEEEKMERSIFEEIFVKYGKSLNTFAKRGIFLLGALTQMLLNKQYADRNSKPPFMKKLKSLKMDEKDIKALLPEVINKLEEYEAFDKGKKLLAQEASIYLLQAGDNWRMSIDEINYYFVCGMNLYDEVAKVVYGKGKQSKND
ncbi:MAG: TIGR02556 family CRISPR-associated protein [Thermodesulfobacterium sp.]|nr:TIGR02556 family CRISPR-associated protein [Thermodesulfobacterium sp.]